MQQHEAAVNDVPVNEADAKQFAGLSPSSGSARLVHWITFLLLLVAAIAVRLKCLTLKPFWSDECFSVAFARISWGSFLRLLWWREANMSLYYVLLRIWLHFGQSEFFIRSLSILIAVATLPAIYWLARMLYDRRVALIATALLTFNAYHVRYSQEARSYTLFVLLATLSSGFLVALLKAPTRHNKVGYVVTSTLAVYAHFYALLLVLAHWLALRWLGAPGRANDARHVEISAQLRRSWKIISIGVLPVLIFVVKTGAGPIHWIPRPGIEELLRFAIYLTDGIPLIYFAACLLALVPLRKNLLARSNTWDTWRVHFLFIWLLFPILLTVVLSFARPVFLPRYMVFCIPALLILAAAGLASVRPAWLNGTCVVLILLLSARFVPFVYAHDLDTERDASGAATNFILEHTQLGDAVIFHIAASRVPYEFFRSLRAGENTASPSFTGQLGPEILFPHNSTGLDYRDFTGKPTEDFVRTVAPGHPRVWVMLMNNSRDGNLDATTLMLTKVLPEMYPKVVRWQFPRVELRLYSKQ